MKPATSLRPHFPTLSLCGSLPPIHTCEIGPPARNAPLHPLPGRIECNPSRKAAKTPPADACARLQGATARSFCLMLTLSRLIQSPCPLYAQQQKNKQTNTLRSNRLALESKQRVNKMPPHWRCQSRPNICSASSMSRLSVSHTRFL